MKTKKKIIRASTIPLSLDIFCKGLLQELSEEYEVVALSSPGELLDKVERREGVRAIRIPMERHISLRKDIGALWRLIKVFRKEKPYIVHSITPKAGLLCMIAAWVARVPIRIHTFTGLIFPYVKGLTQKVLMLTDAITCACATHVIAEGKGVKLDLIGSHITRKPVRVLGHGNIRGVEMNYYSRRTQVMNIAQDIIRPDMVTFTFVGRIGKDKGIDELCEAFRLLSKEYKNVRLFIVGPMENDVDPISERSQIIIDQNPRIEAVGMKEDTELLAYYAASDCFVLPSYREGFPNTVLEAGAMSLPSIVTDINGSREIIFEGKNGTIIPPKDMKALYEAMKRMIEEPEWREKMAGNARKMVGDRFEQSFVRKCLFDFYHDIAE